MRSKSQKIVKSFSMWNQFSVVDNFKVIGGNIKTN